MSPPYRMKAAMISRLKIMADLDIAERRVPQDGRIKIKIFNKMIDLRVSSLPTIYGEKIVMRILDKSNLTLDLTRAGFEQKALDNFLRAIAMPYGMVLVTGPTGSGKTTTLYSALSRINQPEVNIMTAEDPVEYNIEGINQVNVNEDIGLTFAAALRAFLRQDPNIVMVGEIRDLETASIARQGRPDRSPGALHPPHQRRALHAQPAGRHGHRAVPGGVVGQPDPGPAARPAGLPELQGGPEAARRGHGGTGAARDRLGRVPGSPRPRLRGVQ